MSYVSDLSNAGMGEAKKAMKWLGEKVADMKAPAAPAASPTIDLSNVSANPRTGGVGAMPVAQAASYTPPAASPVTAAPATQTPMQRASAMMSGPASGGDLELGKTAKTVGTGAGNLAARGTELLNNKWVGGAAKLGSIVNAGRDIANDPSLSTFGQVGVDLAGAMSAPVAMADMGARATTNAMGIKKNGSGMGAFDVAADAFNPNGKIVNAKVARSMDGKNHPIMNFPFWQEGGLLNPVQERPVAAPAAAAPVAAKPAAPAVPAVPAVDMSMPHGASPGIGAQLERGAPTPSVSVSRDKNGGLFITNAPPAAPAAAAPADAKPAASDKPANIQYAEQLQKNYANAIQTGTLGDYAAASRALKNFPHLDSNNASRENTKARESGDAATKAAAAAQKVREDQRKANEQTLTDGVGTYTDDNGKQQPNIEMAATVRQILAQDNIEVGDADSATLAKAIALGRAAHKIHNRNKNNFALNPWSSEASQGVAASADALRPTEMVSDLTTGWGNWRPTYKTAAGEIPVKELSLTERQALESLKTPRATDKKKEK